MRAPHTGKGRGKDIILGLKLNTQAMILQLAKRGQNKFGTYMHAHNIKDQLLRSNNADRFLR